jgi:hypothetical protein
VTGAAPAGPGLDPRAIYAALLASRREQQARLDRHDLLLSRLRLVAALSALAAWFLSIAPLRLHAGWMLPPLLGFALLVVLHARLQGRRQAAARAVRFYERGLARLELRLTELGDTGAAFIDAAHPYAADLDLFGEGSLWQLLGGARTRLGAERLARMLLHAAPPDEVRRRQAAVAQLRPRLELREDLFVLGDAAAAGLDGRAVAAWGAQARPPASGATRAAAAALAALNVAALGAYWSFDVPGLLPLAALGLAGLFSLALRARVRAALVGLDGAARDLDLLGRVLARLERESFDAGPLAELQRALVADGLSPSSQVRRLSRLIDRLESRRNPLFAPFAALLLWTTRTGLAIAAWRAQCGPHLPAWTAAVAELEALLALASYAFEHPHDPFPEVVDSGPLLDGEGLAHPLIAPARAVPNDVRLDQTLRLLIVSGSNMSGKSTLLRTLGVNVVLALCGAPVRAGRLSLSPLALGTSLHVHDSLQAGQSRFYAEITRLRLLVDLARAEPPLLFLLDELLHGTNSGDRRAGAEAVLRGLVARGALGLVTTHDLALGAVAETLAPAAANVHFEDRLQDGRMTFDYRLRAGVVQRSNALELMRAVGLDV